MQEYRLPKITLALWEARFLLLEIAFLALLSFFGGGYFWYWLAMRIFCFIFAVFQILYLPFLFRSYKITLRKNAVTIDNGVVIHTTHIMPNTKMIYTQTFTSPLAKKFGLSAVALKAARSFLFIPELPVAVVEQISQLTQKDETV